MGEIIRVQAVPELDEIGKIKLVKKLWEGGRHSRNDLIEDVDVVEGIFEVTFTEGVERELALSVINRVAGIKVIE